MKKEQIAKLIELAKVILTILAGFFGGAASSKAAELLSLYS